MRGTHYPGVCTKPGTYCQGWFMYMRYTQGQSEEYLLSRSVQVPLHLKVLNSYRVGHRKSILEHNTHLTYGVCVCVCACVRVCVCVRARVRVCVFSTYLLYHICELPSPLRLQLNLVPTVTNKWS